MKYPLLLGLMAVGAAQAQTVGVNLLSLHERGGYNSFTPGVYVLADRPIIGLNTAGILRNSLGRASVQLGRTWSSPAFTVLGVPFHDVSLSAGGITGYPGATVQPFAIPSFRISGLRTMLIPRKPKAHDEPGQPKASRAVSFSLEF
jgi:hypothetical protein